MPGSLIETLGLLGVGQCLFVLALLGLSPRHANPADRWLAAAMLAFTVSDVAGLVEARLPPDWAGPMVALNMLGFAGIAPAIWLHLDHLLGQAGAPGRAPWRHLLVLLAVLPLAVLCAGGLLGAGFLLFLILQLQQAGYLAVILHRMRRRDLLRDPDPFRVRWTLRLLGVLVVLWGLNLGETLLRLAGLIGAGAAAWLELPPTFGFFLLGLFALDRPRELLAAVEARATAPAGGKYARSGLQPAEAEQLAQRLQSALADEALLADPALSLPRLARRLGASENDLSQACNQCLGRRVPELLAAARIGLAMRRLRDPALAGRTVLEVALDVGFNSKSTFNAAFRKVAGVTPSAWREGEG